MTKFRIGDILVWDTEWVNEHLGKNSIMHETAYIVLEEEPVLKTYDIFHKFNVECPSGDKFIHTPIVEGLRKIA